jgi:hypothetical protein
MPMKSVTLFILIFSCTRLLDAQWIQTPDTAISYTIELDACPDTLRSPTNKNIFYVFENNCGELVSYKGKRRIWRADLKLLFQNPQARATKITHWYAGGKNDSISILSVSNNHQCISVKLNARTGKKILD